MTLQNEQPEIRQAVAKCLAGAVQDIAGGDLTHDAERKKMMELASKSISFPNKNNFCAGGKPHDIEIRLALSLFHKWKRSSSKDQVEIISDMGVTRFIPSPKELAELILLPFESACRREGVAQDVRCQPSGLLCIVTRRRGEILRQAGKLPCPYCTKWCQGEKGLWWHQQQNHKIEYSEAAEVAASSTDSLAIVLFDPSRADSNTLSEIIPIEAPAAMVGSSEPLDYVKNNNLKALQREVNNGYSPANEIDKKGASPLMWAAGSGNLDIVRYLCEVCGCDPNQPQQGKRSFSGRTPLHWAARNGHLHVVRYLMQECQVHVEAATIDGTTAFCWASWQGHIIIMKFLWEHGCDLYTTNSFGCNAVLWAAQGKANITIMKWLEAKGCDMIKVNNNGHGVLHKAAQRGQSSVCKWFFEHWIGNGQDVVKALSLVGPDAEGYCPSDLAGMEGHDDLAKKLAIMEMDFIANLSVDHTRLPSWLTETREGVGMRVFNQELYNWERYGGQRRMRSRLFLVPTSS